jgi:orotate phosphoribosyltransferase
VLVGAALKGRRVLIIDDVITAGTAIREALDIIQSAEGIIIGTVVCLDRQEKATEDSSDSAIQQVTKEYGFPVLSIIQLDHLISYIVLQLSTPSSAEGHSATIEERKALLTQIESYRSQYGVK